jgi:hypothetical protein
MSKDNVCEAKLPDEINTNKFDEVHKIESILNFIDHPHILSLISGKTNIEDQATDVFTCSNMICHQLSDPAKYKSSKYYYCGSCDYFLCLKCYYYIFYGKNYEVTNWLFTESKICKVKFEKVDNNGEKKFSDFFTGKTVSQKIPENYTYKGEEYTWKSYEDTTKKYKKYLEDQKHNNDLFYGIIPTEPYECNKCFHRYSFITPHLEYYNEDKPCKNICLYCTNDILNEKNDSRDLTILKHNNIDYIWTINEGEYKCDICNQEKYNKYGRFNNNNEDICFN